jgi:hypothetical protein
VKPSAPIPIGTIAAPVFAGTVLLAAGLGLSGCGIIIAVVLLTVFVVYLFMTIVP